MHTLAKMDWDRYAKWYDTLNTLHPYADMLDTIAAHLRPATGPLLDAGCGTGNLLRKLALQGKQSLLGIDSSPTMLERARSKCSSAEFLRVDLNEALPFEDRTFAAVTCVNALYALNCPRRTVREFCRVLKPHGMMLIVTPRSYYENGLILKEHCGSTKPASYWLDVHRDSSREKLLVHEAISDKDLARRFLWIAHFNRAIARHRSFHFFVPEELSCLVQKNGFKLQHVQETYARQNILLIAKRAHGRKHYDRRHCDT